METKLDLAKFTKVTLYPSKSMKDARVGGLQLQPTAAMDLPQLIFCL